MAKPAKQRTLVVQDPNHVQEVVTTGIAGVRFAHGLVTITYTIDRSGAAEDKQNAVVVARLAMPEPLLAPLVGYLQRIVEGRAKNAAGRKAPAKQ